MAKTRIAFTSDRDATKPPRGKELYIVDYDGFNAKRITVNNSLNILPAWSPDGRALAYTSYKQGSPSIFVARIFEGRSDNLTKGDGQAFAPTFSPDASRSRTPATRPGTWRSDRQSGRHGARRITSSPGIDTAPRLEPDRAGDRTFNSDRAGIAPDIRDGQRGPERPAPHTVGNWNDAPA